MGAVCPLASGPTSVRRCVGYRQGTCNPSTLGERAPASWGEGPRARDHVSVNMREWIRHSHIVGFTYYWGEGPRARDHVSVYAQRALSFVHNGIHTFWGQAFGAGKGLKAIWKCGNVEMSCPSPTDPEPTLRDTRCISIEGWYLARWASKPTAAALAGPQPALPIVRPKLTPSWAMLAAVTKGCSCSCCCSPGLGQRVGARLRRLEKGRGWQRLAVHAASCTAMEARRRRGVQVRQEGEAERVRSERRACGFCSRLVLGLRCEPRTKCSSSSLEGAEGSRKVTTAETEAIAPNRTKANLSQLGGCAPTSGDFATPSAGRRRALATRDGHSETSI